MTQFLNYGSYYKKKDWTWGTLDPDVVGVLPIAVGKATRVIEYMTEAGKVYEGQVTLGYSTTTEDASGGSCEIFFASCANRRTR